MHRARGILRRAGRRERGHVGAERLARGGGAQRGKRLGPGAAVLDRRRAVAQVDVDGAPREAVRVAFGSAVQPVGDELARPLFEHPVRLPGRRHAADVAARRIGCRGVDAGGRKRRRVGRAQVSRDVRQHDPVLRRGAVQILAVRMAALREQRVVVADAVHEAARRDVALGDPGRDLADDIVDGIDVADRRRMQRERIQRPSHRQEVAVRVDEAGQQRALAQLDHARGVAAQRHDLVRRTGRGNRLAADRHGFDARPRRVHRDDDAAGKDDVGRRPRVRRAAARGERSSRRERDEGDGTAIHEGLTLAAGAAAVNVPLRRCRRLIRFWPPICMRVQVPTSAGTHVDLHALRGDNSLACAVAAAAERRAETRA